MTEDEAAARRKMGVAGAGVCCCVMVHRPSLSGPSVIVCDGPTTGPDDPFCSDCEDRHVAHPAVVMGLTEVTQRLRWPGGAG